MPSTRSTTRFTFLALPILAAALVPVVGGAPRALGDSPLTPGRMYTALHGNPSVHVAESVTGELALALLQHDGTEIVRVEGVRTGSIDLSIAMPEVWSLERAAWLQLLADDAPVGAPLVVHPLRDRPALRTAGATRPDGVTSYTRIVGWGKLPLDPQNEADVALAETWTEEEESPLSGLRMHVDADVILETVHGDIRISLRPDEAPNTAWNFRELAEGGLYEGTIFHRVVPLDKTGHPFVIQGGDPSRTGLGGPGRTIPIEPSRLPHDFGVVSMARSDDPDSAGSQYFICLSRAGTARLDGQYCAFGEVVAGAEAILAIAATEIADPASGRPVDPPQVLRATLTPAPPRTPGAGRADRRVLPPQPKDERTPSGHDPR